MVAPMFPKSRSSFSRDLERETSKKILSRFSNISASRKQTDRRSMFDSFLSPRSKKIFPTYSARSHTESSQDGDFSGAPVTRLGRLKRFLHQQNMRRTLKRYLSVSPVGYYIDLTNLALSSVSVALYIIGLYNDELQEIFMELDLSFCVFFLMDYMLRLFLAEQRIRFVASPLAIVDLITILPALLAFVEPPTSWERFVQLVLLLRVLRIVRVNRFVLSYMDSEVSKTVAALATNMVTVIVFCAGVVHILENSYRQEQLLPLYMYHDMLYFVVVTVTTVGYGDIAPLTWEARMLILVVISAALIYVPRASNKLIQILSQTSVYQRARYKPASHVPHVVIMGSIDIVSARAFLTELFHEDHGSQDMNAVFLCESDPTAEFESMIRAPHYINNVTWLTGSCMSPADMLRAGILDASACFVLCNKFTTDPDTEDAGTILKALSIKRFILEVTGRDILTSLQLLKYENKPHFVLSSEIMKNDLLQMNEDEIVQSQMSAQQTGLSVASSASTRQSRKQSRRYSRESFVSQIVPGISNSLTDGHEDDPIICINEIKMNLLAQSCLCPGIITMIGNLAMSVDDPEDKNGEHEQWLSEYQQGSSFEMYRTELSPVFEGVPFCTASQLVHQYTGALMFALELGNRNGFSRVILNPGSSLIPSVIEYEVRAFVIAEDMASADFSDLEIAMKSFAPDTRKSGSRFAPFNAPEFVSKLESAKRGAEPKPSHAPVTAAGGAVSGIADAQQARKSPPENSRWNLVKQRINGGESFAEKEEQVEDSMNEMKSATSSGFFLLPGPIDFERILVKNSLATEFPEIRDHAIICGSISGLHGLIKTLRAKHLAELLPIVILHPEIPPVSLWTQIAIFPSVIFVQGSPVQGNDLIRAGVQFASKAIILAQSSRKGISDKAEVLTDAQAIFAHQGIIGLNSRIQIVTELISNSNMGFLDMGRVHSDISRQVRNMKHRDVLNEENVVLSKQQANAKYHSQLQFITGIIYSSSILDTLTCQSFYNQHITTVFRLLIAGETKKKLHAQQGSRVQSEVFIDSLATSYLFQIPVPKEMKGHLYSELFEELSHEYSMVPLGLYRGVESQFSKLWKGNSVPYVYTNPPGNTVLGAKDRVYVLSQKAPPPKLLGRSVLDLVTDLKLRNRLVSCAKVVPKTPMPTSPPFRASFADEEVKALKQEVSELKGSLNEIRGLLLAQAKQE